MLFVEPYLVISVIALESDAIMTEAKSVFELVIEIGL